MKTLRGHAYEGGGHLLDGHGNSGIAKVPVFSETPSAAWTAVQMSIAENSASDPDGGATASTLTPSSAASVQHYLNSSLGATYAGGDYVLFVKLIGGSAIDAVSIYPGGGGTFATFRLDTLTTATEANVQSASISALADDWYKLTAVYGAGVTVDRWRLYASSGPNGFSATTENGTDGILVYKAQVLRAP